MMKASFPVSIFDSAELESLIVSRTICIYDLDGVCVCVCVCVCVSDVETVESSSTDLGFLRRQTNEKGFHHIPSNYFSARALLLSLNHHHSLLMKAVVRKCFVTITPDPPMTGPARVGVCITSFWIHRPLSIEHG
jgi:hypothetical protein